MTQDPRPLIVAVLTETFSPKMGYIQNTLPKYLAGLGVEVHLLTEDLLPSYELEDFKGTYGEFGADVRLTPGAVERLNGFTVHVLGHKKVLGPVRMQGMFAKLRELRPAVVQVHAANGWLALDAALGKTVLGYKLFTGAHITASVFPLAQLDREPLNLKRVRSLFRRDLPGRFISWTSEKCYGATVDCADVAVRFLGVQQKKMEICPLGVDTDLFQPMISKGDYEARAALRQELGFGESDIVCVYSGRFSEGKDPLILAQAIEKLRRARLPYRGLFIGGGAQESALRAGDGCVVRPFVPVYELKRYFHASEIGVWPKQESMSMLDAAACGIPIVVNSTLKARERIEGNGLIYNYGEVDDMVRVLVGLKEAGERKSLGDCGAHRMRTEFGWDVIARRRLRDYETAVNGGSRS
jgi:glycosyltransferase involved in cell wall biosynthesis